MGRQGNVASAHRQVRLALKNGELAREHCEACGAEKAVAHHDDYEKPLEVRWLCRPCHAKHHSQKRRASEPPRKYFKPATNFESMKGTNMPYTVAAAGAKLDRTTQQVRMMVCRGWLETVEMRGGALLVTAKSVRAAKRAAEREAAK